ncbi:AP-4 complex subunit mu-1 [Coccomyxa sp. Obi]|nr:AP-4 complex subunit mu-1 [Coccomyxa sp. Obi]
MISQFFILSPRGDTIIMRDYLGNVPKASSEIFFRKVNFWDKGGRDAPPVFNVDGVSYLYVKDGGVFLVATTRENVSPSLVLELLKRIGGIIKDYCGLLSEEAVRKNFVLLYELLDEVIDYGYPQNSSSEALKEFVLNEPTMLKPSKSKGDAMFSGVGKGPTGVIKSILDTSRTEGKAREEIFVDIVEKISCTFSSSGHVQTSQIDGAIQVKSYLTGNPAIAIALNDSLVIGRRETSGSVDYGGYGRGSDTVMLDDCNFHQSVSLDRFETERTLQLVPPDGEFAVMNYRSTYPFKPPFRVSTTVDEDPNSALKAIITIRITPDFGGDKAASGLEVVVPMPREVARVHCELGRDAKSGAAGQTWDWQERARRLVWKFKRVQGGLEHTLRVRATLSDGWGPSIKKSIGPINLQFTIPMYCASRLQVRYLQILKEHKSHQPYRWVRYVTLSNSYVVRT